LVKTSYFASFCKMDSKISLLGQIIKLLDKNIIRSLISQHKINKFTKGIDFQTHLVCMLFSQLGNVNTLRDISNILKSQLGRINHLGIKRIPAKSTLSYINSTRSWIIYKDLYYSLLDRLSKDLKLKKSKFKIRNSIYLLDSTLISLTLSVFDWAPYRQRKGALKIHTLLDYNNHLPKYIVISDGETHDKKAAEQIELEKGSIIVADRAYLSSELFYLWDKAGVKFLVRSKDTIKYKVIKERELNANQSDNILLDEEIKFVGQQTSKNYPKKLRRVVVYDADKNSTVILLTNNFYWTANTISQLYKARWQIEIFFKEIKQHLQIKTFLGTSFNAVMIQIWSTMISILLLKYIKNKAKDGWQLSNLIAVIRMNLLTYGDLWSILESVRAKPPKIDENRIKLTLF